MRISGQVLPLVGRTHRRNDSDRASDEGNGPAELAAASEPTARLKGGWQLADLREGSRFVRWRGEQFRFERLQDRQAFAHLNPVWAVSRHREFIGTMSSVAAETTKQFEVRCVSWLAALLG